MKRYWKKILGLIVTGFVVVLMKPATAQPIEFILIQMNDVYEITPVAGGKAGGLARVATVRQQLLAENPHTYTIMAGDFFSPSALGTAKVNGESLAGQQMVAVLNALGLDYATFGNHEFDLKENQFYQRLQESQFKWFSGNVFNTAGQPFPGVKPYEILTIAAGNTSIKVGLIGVTIASNPAEYVTYRDPIEVAKAQVNLLKDQVDIIIAITHLNLAKDQELAESIPEIDLILGGHEHENIQQWRGSDFTPIFKADANARTVYIHRLRYDPATKQLEIDSKILPITDEIPDDLETAKIVEKWVTLGFSGFRENGFEPQEQVGITTVPLDGLETSVRNKRTQLTQLIAEGMLQEVPEADLAIFNGGSIRLDDVIPPGPVTQYDVIRILPFGGHVVSVEMSGEVLQQVLNQGLKNQGTGGYLHTANVDFNADNQTWLISEKPLDPNQTYRVSISEFLLTGKEIGLNFLTPQNPGIQVIEQKRDIRFAVIDQLKKQSQTSINFERLRSSISTIFPTNQKSHTKILAEVYLWVG
jgi:5'-nucleotidase/UDP-sugar diphosphatase